VIGDLRKQLTYEEYINSRAWDRRRVLYFGAHRRACRFCGDTKNVQLHHRTYVRMGAELDDDLVPLCQQCHSMVHQLQRDNQITVEEAMASVERAFSETTRPDRSTRRPEPVRMSNLPPWPSMTERMKPQGKDPMASRVPDRLHPEPSRKSRRRRLER